MRRPLGITILLIAVSLAGCADSGQEAEDPDETHVDLGDGIVVGPGLGALDVEVRNDQGFALKDARVSLLRTDFFGDTDRRGRILFTNVTPGQHELQAKSPGFEATLVPVEVAAGALTNVTVTMVPEFTAGAGYRPHMHDHWEGSSEYVLMDDRFSLHERANSGLPDEYSLFSQGVLRANNNASRWAVPILETPHDGPAIVLPGTAEMEVTLAWDDATTHLDRLGLCYDSPAPDDERCFGAHPSGHTYTIALTPEMTDTGHQLWSLWELLVYKPGYEEAPDYEPGVAIGDLQVHILLRKGELFLEPPHRDFWADGAHLVLRNGSEPEESTSMCCSAQPTLRLDDGQIVPPGATQLRATFAWELQGTGPEELEPDFELLFRTGDMNPHSTTVDDYETFEPVEGSYEEKRKVYELDLDKSQTDAFYQSKSTWRFQVWNTDLERSDYNIKLRGQEFYLTVEAFNDDL